MNEYMMIVYFLAATVAFAVITYIWSNVQSERFPRGTRFRMLLMAGTGIIALILWVGSVSPPAAGV